MDANARNMIMMQGSSNLHGMLPPDQEVIDAPDRATPGNRRTKTRAPGGSIKSENNKDCQESVVLHKKVQEMFALHLASTLNDPRARDLQCCVTYGKPCGCIRKYILAGPHWKSSNLPHLRINPQKKKDDEIIIANDQAAIAQTQIARAQELVEILHHAAELKKEKCYVTNEGTDGKPMKELRGMIGLGNGRKRSKKYEDYVLEKRGKLRTDYSLCEKAAQKLLGYSINFLYKKLRTNPQKTSRLVATNKAERASRVPRHLISLQQLQEMANNQQGASQCCCRNCISWLVKQHFDKIVDWRQRLEGSGQRVAQEIVAEVLLASASLDGQNSFCQNLVHWVTGCSFKKIRRVRDHLKKDPKSLPEHGLKKYWKDKVRNQGKAPGDQYNNKPNMIAKMEKSEEAYLGGVQPMDRFPAQYDGRRNGRSSGDGTSGTQVSNINNSNNRYDNQPAYVSASSPSAPPNQTVHNTGLIGMIRDTYGGLPPGTAFGLESTPVYQQLQRHQGDTTNQQMYTGPLQPSQPNIPAPGMSNIASNYPGQNSSMSQNFTLQPQAQSGTSYQAPPDSNYQNQQNFATKVPVGGAGARVESSIDQQPPSNRNNTISQNNAAQYQDTQTIQQPAYPQSIQPKDDAAKFYPASFIAGFTDPNSNAEGGPPSYYFAANPSNPQQDGFFHTGMTPLFLAQAQQPDGNQGNQDCSTASQFTGQSFFLLSPALPNNSDKHGDFENWKHMVMPITPVQMYPASYFQNGVQSEAGNGKAMQAWGAAEGQHFMFPVGEAGMMFNASAEHDIGYVDQQGVPIDSNKRQQNFAQGGQHQAYFQPTALTPVAVVQPQGSNFISDVGWFATQPAVPTQQVPEQPAQQKKANVNSQQYATAVDPNRKKFYPEQSTDQAQQYYNTEKMPLPMISQWAPRGQGFAEAQQATNRWINKNEVHEQKAQLPQQPASQQPTSLPQVNTSSQVQLPSSKSHAISTMPPLAPLQGISAKVAPSTTRSSHNTDVNIISNSTETTVRKSSPKGAPIGDRSKRFSRERLRATIDSPCPIAPMTPLTPALTPSVLAGVQAASGEKPDSSKEGSNAQALDNNVFLFPPTHISRRMAALRMQGHTTDISKGDKLKENAGEPKPTDESRDDNARGKPTSTVGATNSRAKESSHNSDQDSTSSKALEGSLSSCNSLGYISEAFLQNDNPLLTDLNNVKTLPVLSLSSAGWTDENVTVKPTTSEAGAEQHLQTPTPVLNTPTHQLTPSVHTPTHQLHTPNQALHTPNQPLNTPTQPLNTPTDLTPLSHSSSINVSEEDSPVKVLMPAPTGKKRKAENMEGSDDKCGNQKQIRFHNFKPEDFAGGEVNVSAFRKPTEYVSTTQSTTPKRRRKPRKQTNPQAHDPVQTIEILDDADKSDHSADEEEVIETGGSETPLVMKETMLFTPAKSTPDETVNPENVVLVTNTANMPPLKTPAVLQQFTPVFSVPPSSSEDTATTSTAIQSQLNTPVFLHSGALMTPSGKLSSLFRRASPSIASTSGKVASTPQFFTFMPAGGFPTQAMFLTPTDPSDTKNKPNRPKSSESNNENSSDKPKSSPMKRSQMTLSFSARSLPDDALQTPSKIQVVTPSANPGNAASNVPQIFCFQDFPTQGKSVSTGSEKIKTPDKGDPTKGQEEAKTDELPKKEVPKSPTVEADMQEKVSSRNESSKAEEALQQIRAPSLIVNPPSDNEDDGDKNEKESSSVRNSDGKSSPEKLDKRTPEKEAKTSASNVRPTLHRARSGGKTDLFLSLSTVSAPAGEPAETVAPSPLNTPSGIPVITPTMATVMSASKLTSPAQRLPPGMRVRPQSLVMAPICLNPPTTPSTQVATPTLFHIISPSQAAPSSPSVLVYAYPPRGFVKGSAPLPSASVGNSPLYGIIQRPSAPSGNASGSLLKSALMKKLPVFQFPPAVRATTPTSDSAAAFEKDTGDSSRKSTDGRQRLNSAPDYCGETPSSSSETADVRPSSTGGLAVKLSGANDPCLSEAAQ